MQTVLLANKLIDNYSMATTGDLASPVIEIKLITGFAVHIVWSGASATDADVLTQGSNDGINFVTIDTCDINTASGQRLLNVERAMYSYIRVFFDKNSETTGTLNVTISGKAE